MADRAPRPLADGEVLELGAMRVRHIATPHVPHGWESCLYYEETTNTLLAGDLFTHLGNGPALTGGDILGLAREGEELFGYSSLTPQTASRIRALAELEPTTLALMHGSSFAGDGGSALRGLADFYADRIASN